MWADRAERSDRLPRRFPRVDLLDLASGRGHPSRRDRLRQRGSRAYVRRVDRHRTGWRHRSWHCHRTAGVRARRQRGVFRPEGWSDSRLLLPGSQNGPKRRRSSRLGLRRSLLLGAHVQRSARPSEQRLLLLYGRSRRPAGRDPNLRRVTSGLLRHRRTAPSSAQTDLPGRRGPVSPHRDLPHDLGFHRLPVLRGVSIDPDHRAARAASM